MKEQLISEKTAKLAKEKGFGDTLDTIDLPERPTQSLLQKWLRDNCNIIVELTSTTKNKFSCVVIKNKKVTHLYENNKIYPYEYKTYEEALEKGLQEALKLIR